MLELIEKGLEVDALGWSVFREEKIKTLGKEVTTVSIMQFELLLQRILSYKDLGIFQKIVGILGDSLKEAHVFRVHLLPFSFLNMPQFEIALVHLRDVILFPHKPLLQLVVTDLLRCNLFCCHFLNAVLILDFTFML